MKYFFTRITSIFYFFFFFLLCACSSVPPQMLEESRQIPEDEVPQTIPEDIVVERPRPPEDIMGKGMAEEEKLALFLMSNNVMVDSDFARSLASIYIEEAAVEGVNHDVAFAQMCLETASLQYGGLVTQEMNNFCGLGSTGAPGPNGPERGAVFPDPRTGVRAHIQHLKAYASKEPLNQELVDPRYHYVKLGSSPTIYGLAGRWAMDAYYSRKIASILKKMYDFSF
jgi:hypothetical protein